MGEERKVRARRTRLPDAPSLSSTVYKTTTSLMVRDHAAVFTTTFVSLKYILFGPRSHNEYIKLFKANRKSTTS